MGDVNPQNDTQAKTVFAQSGTLANQGNIIFLSDGAANSNNYATQVDDLRAIGVNLRAIGVGSGSSLPGLQIIDSNAQKVTSTDELVEAFGPEDELLANVEVFADINGNGLQDVDEPFATTQSDNPFTAFNESGAYLIENLSPGLVSVRPKNNQFQLTVNSTLDIQPVVRNRHLLAVQSIGTIASPIITLQPGSQTIPATQSASFVVLATGDEPLVYQWRKDGLDIPGANSNIFLILSATPNDVGIYSVTVQNAAGSVTSQDALLEVTTDSTPFSIDRSSLDIVNLGANRFFGLTVNGTPGRTYQAFIKNELNDAD